jgi:hypothetical protein
MVDKNGDGRIDLDDLLIGLREAFQWALSWRGAMVLYMGFTVMSAWLNVEAWDIVLRPAGQASLTFAVLIWGTLQMNELLPILDDLNLKASIGALIRLQRKPIKVPVVNETLVPAARSQIRKYRNRERKLALFSEFVRYACYGLELAILVGGGSIFSSIGVNWIGVIKAIVGIVGVEIGVRKINECGEKLLNPDEREFLKEIEAAVSRSTVRVEPDKTAA